MLASGAMRQPAFRRNLVAGFCGSPLDAAICSCSQEAVFVRRCEAVSKSLRRCLHSACAGVQPIDCT
jgi:hypothetical protein